MIKLQIISIAISIVLFFDVQWQVYLKRIFKQPKTYVKPFDCFRCNMFWIGQLVGLAILPNWKEYILLSFINIITSFTISKLWT